ncbi:MAG: alginate lyase family protein [Bacteroidales bacterium]|nr:alginate lyase family protein [Bacteroidales bacterium]
MKPFRSFLATALLICLTTNTNAAKQAPAIWNIQHLQNVKTGIKENKPVYRDSYKMLVKNANAELTKPNPTVMDKPKAAISGDKHDYISLARYFWPNPATRDSMPYISRDGESNPELNLYDRNRLGNMCNSVCNLSLAYYFTGDKAYSKKAVSILRTWFLDPKTKVNPNLKYSQVARGHDGDNGRPSGLIDTYSYIGLLDAITLLDLSDQIPQQDLTEIKAWFRELTKWMQTAENGIKDDQATNNHSIAYDVQVAMFARFAGNEDVARKVINAFPERRLAAQIKPDGSQPRELTRTIAFHYSVYNIAHMMDMCDLASNMGIKLYDSSNGAIDRAIGWLMPYIDKPKTFPYKQINDWKTVEKSFLQQIYRASVYSKDKRYVPLYNQFKAAPEDCVFTLLFVK